MIHSLRVLFHSSYVFCLGGDLFLFIGICLFLKLILLEYSCFPDGSDGEESACNAGDPGLIPGSERSPGEENGNSSQYSCLGNPMDRGACRAAVDGAVDLDILSD